MTFLQQVIDFCKKILALRVLAYPKARVISVETGSDTENWGTSHMTDGFKAFLMRGNVVDLAVGVIIGAAFGGVVDSLTKDIIGPILGMVGGLGDFSAYKVGPFLIGNFINAVLAFLIKAATVYFFVVLPLNNIAARMAAAPPPPPPPPPSEEYLREIRDLLAKSRVASA